MAQFGAEHGLEGLVVRIASMVPWDQRRQPAERLQCVLAVATVRDAIIDIFKPIRRRHLVERDRGIQMDAAQCYPPEFELRVLPKLGLSGEVPLPAVSKVIVV